VHFESAYEPPPTLGEAYHYLQAKADVNYWKGRAYQALHEPDKARTHFEMSATETGDFLEMSVTAHSPLTFYRGLSLAELGRPEQAKALFESLAAYARKMEAEPATIDYFATSLPLMLVFDEDLQGRKQVEAIFLHGLAQRGLGDLPAAIASFEEVLQRNRSHLGAGEQLQELREASERNPKPNAPGDGFLSTGGPGTV
jgi:tetratricopeptide (TPR) repeat protein